MRSASKIPWYRSIITRITMVFILLVVAATLVAGMLVHRGGEVQLDELAREELTKDLELGRLRVEGSLSLLGDDILFLSTSDPIHEFIRARRTGDTMALQRSLERVALLMSSFIQSREQYAQVRLLANDSVGMELVRFDRLDGGVARVADSELQPKGNREYFRASLEQPHNGTYFSPIDLNKERGGISYPLMPTIRAARPLHDSTGAVQGVVIINADLRPLFKELTRPLLPRETLILADPTGELLVHPDTNKVFRKEFGGSSTVTGLLKIDPVPIERPVVVDEEIWLFGSFHIPGQGDHLIGIATNTAPLMRQLRDRRNEALGLVLLLAGLFGSLSFFLARGLVRPLQRISDRLPDLAEGRSLEEFPLDRKDELGILARGFSRMQLRIDERVNEVRKALEAAERSERQRRDLVANMSHEVRTPLNAILGMSGAIDPANLDNADRERLSIVHRSAERLRALVDDLLVQARLDEGRLSVKAVSVDLPELMRDVAQTHARAAQAKGIALRFHTQEAPERFCTDPLRLHQIVDNLLGNAVKFTTQGQVDLILRTSGTGGLVLEVKDTGPGIAKNRHAEVFERFEHAEHADDTSPGAGLGLAITKQLVELLEGTIQLDSSPGLGSTFTVELPPLQPAKERASAEVDPESTRGLQVLHVEDVATNRMLMEQYAHALGWMLTSVVSGEEALSLDASFDIILIDLDLGEGMNGMELTGRLRGMNRHRTVPVIAVTAFTGPEHEAQALKAGMNDILTKPVLRNDLLEKAAFWTEQVDEGEEDIPDLRPLIDQFDGDQEKFRSALRQYRREFVQWRIDLHQARETSDDIALKRTLHRLKPHLKLFGMNKVMDAFNAVPRAEEQVIAWEELEDVFRKCDRAFMRGMTLEDPTTGPSAP